MNTKKWLYGVDIQFHFTIITLPASPVLIPFILLTFTNTVHRLLQWAQECGVAACSALIARRKCLIVDRGAALDFSASVRESNGSYVAERTLVLGCPQPLPSGAGSQDGSLTPLNGPTSRRCLWPLLFCSFCFSFICT